MNNTTNEIVPEQEKGIETNTENSTTLKTRHEALSLFRNACTRLLNVNTWHNLSGTGSAKFRLANPDGNKEERLAKVNDHFQIDLPAPGTITGDGYDWVKVEKIEDNSNDADEEETFAIKVRPCSNPNNAKEDIAHFLTDDSTSTFMVRREGNTVTAGVYGRNEVANLKADKLIDKVRNLAVGAGAMAGVSKIQWGMLTKGLLSNAADK